MLVNVLRRVLRAGKLFLNFIYILRMRGLAELRSAYFFDVAILKRSKGGQMPSDCMVIVGEGIREVAT